VAARRVRERRVESAVGSGADDELLDMKSID
jgi:hypothetical protein